MPVAPTLRRRVGALAVPVLLAGVVTAAAPGFLHITVHRGDTLSAIAQRHHTTVARLVALNSLPGNGNLIYAGQTLTVPAGATGAVTRTVDMRYTVRPGDSLYAIAARFHVAPRVIAQRNSLPASLMVRIGQHLVIPTTRTSSAPSSVTSAGRYPSGVVQAATRRRQGAAARSQPSRAQMRSIIAATARRWGLDPALALAISWQESGFNQRMVSNADAIGAMQVLPATGQFVSRYLAHRSLDLMDAHDNATAGVALLKSLVDATGRADQAVAAYYQGLASVRAHGMYAETKAYVRNVLALRHRFA